MADKCQGARPKTKAPPKTSPDLHEPSSIQAVHKTPGYAFLIVSAKQDLPPLPATSGASRNVTPKYEKRSGAKRDKDSFKLIFKDTLGMDWRNEDKWRSLTASDWNHELGQGAAPPKCECLCCRIRALDFSNTDKLVLVISSHGVEDQEPVAIMQDWSTITRSNIIEGLRDEKCPNLKGKLRIILMCTCRVDSRRPDKTTDTGVAIKVRSCEEFHELRSGNMRDVDDDNLPDNPGDIADTDDDKESGDADTDSDDDLSDTDTDSDEAASKGDEDRKYLQIPKDFIFAYSVPIGKSKRSHKYGSWMMKELVNVIRDEPFKDWINFLQVLTLTNDRVCQLSTFKERKNEKGETVVDEKRSGHKNTMCIEHRLTKQIFFRKEPPPALPSAPMTED